MEISRRLFLTGAVAGLALAQPLEPWRLALLDIHHISTGRGNSVLIICADGTSIMVDAGAVESSEEGLGPARPDASRRPGEWIGRYALQHLRTAPRQHLDYFVLTHLHGDHMGDVTSQSPVSSHGDYRLTGVSDVAELIPIRRLIDRGFPGYDYPAPSRDVGTQNYIQFARSIGKRGTTVERIKVGSRDQISARQVEIRALAANGEVWTGYGSETRSLFPPLDTLKPNELPTENACSIALRVSYGAFRYYIGADLTCDTNFGAAPWMDVETAVAKVAGPVSVSALDHHGYFDATCPDFVRYMRSRVYILQSWHASGGKYRE